MSFVLTVQGNPKCTIKQTRLFLLLKKKKGVICIVYCCFFVLSTLSLWSRVNGVHWWRGEQGVLVEGVKIVPWSK
jgi:hypothetical protein